jgi:hypothetical protein
MTSELVSGPDLGGGYLHQLSLDRDGERTTFTYHAQDGGADANGPPKGPLDAFGSVHPPSPCMFGGPRCWHRRFLLPPSETLRVRQAYHRYRFVLQTILDQTYDPVPPRVETALEELLRRILAPLTRERIDWYVGGSTAAWLLGAEVAPADIDLGTTPLGVGRIAGLLGEYLIEPLAPTDWPAAGTVLGARAFVGTPREGTRVEWSTPLAPRPTRPFDEWSGQVSTVRLANASFRGQQIRVTRPEYALVRALEKRRARSAEAITVVVRRLGPDRELLEALLDRSTLATPERHGIREKLLGV